MKILVTGGTGFLGRELVRVLVAAGHDLTVLSRNPGSVRAACGPGVQAMASLSEWTPSMYFDAVVNLAGEPIVDAAWTESRKAALRDSRVALTDRLVACIAAAGTRPAVLLSGSAIGYYGDAGDAALDEDAPPAADFAAQLCRDWEASALAAERLGVRVCLLRTGLVLDPSGGLLGKMVTPFRFGLGGRLGRGTQWMSWISRDDWVAAVLALLEDRQARAPYNLTAPQPVTNAAFTRALARAVRRPAVVAVPATALKLALGERAPMVLGGQRVLPSRLLAAGFRFRHPGIDVALGELIG